MAQSIYSRLGTSQLVDPNKRSRSVTVTGDQTIPFIAAREYQEGYNSESWRQIAEYNGILDLDEVPAGTLLLIPALQAIE